MTYDSREASRHSGQPFELFLFQTETATWRMTSADRPITFNGDVYEVAAVTRTATEQGQELKSGIVKIAIPRTHPLAEEFVAFIPSTPMSIVIFRGHEGEDDGEVVTIFTGGISAAQFTDVCELTAVPESELLKRRIPAPRYQKPCNHILYDSGCTVDKEAFKTTATLTSVNGDTIQATEFAGEVDGWFNAGYIEKGTERRMIISHVGNTLVLLNPMAGLVVTDVVFAYAGCKRDFATCVAKFDNQEHFLGFEWIPQRNPFDGGIE